MALRTLRRNLSGLFKIKGTGVSLGLVDETPQHYLKLITKCTRQLDSMVSLRFSATAVRFNHEQCQYLLYKLRMAVQNAQSFSASVPADMARYLEILKFLFALAKAVESFIQGCCKDPGWVQSAISMANESGYISSLCFNLELCTIVFSTGEKEPATSAVAALRAAEAATVKAKASVDEMRLIEDVAALIQSSKPNSEEWQLATFLLERLRSCPDQDQGVAAPEFNHLFKNLEQVEMLGQGGFGTVYRARWFGAEVAKKVFHGHGSQGMSDFLQEVSILKRLRHPNIVSLLWYMTDMRKCYMIMELMDGSLHSLMEKRMEEGRESPFPISEALDIMLQVAEGMLFLHEKKIVHRDLKSHNILVKRAKAAADVNKSNTCLKAKVADFGLSKTKESSATLSDQTQNQGSSRWMAPEVIKFVKGVTASQSQQGDPGVQLKFPFKSDIYSFAMVCYEILSGNVPFHTLSNNDAKKKVLADERPQLPSECPTGLKSLIEACWSSNPATRPCFAEICAELRYLKFEHLMKLAESARCVVEKNAMATAAVTWHAASTEQDSSPRAVGKEIKESSSGASPSPPGLLHVFRFFVIKSVRKRPSETTATEYRGVRYSEELNKYVSEIRPPRSSKKIWLGAYDTAEEAARAFDVGNLCCNKNLPLNFHDSRRFLKPFPHGLPPGERHSAIAKFAKEAVRKSTLKEFNWTAFKYKEMHTSTSTRTIVTEQPVETLVVLEENGIWEPTGSCHVVGWDDTDDHHVGWDDTDDDHHAAAAAAAVAKKELRKCVRKANPSLSKKVWIGTYSRRRRLRALKRN